MLLCIYFMVAISATILVTSQASHLSAVFPEEICLLRSHVDLEHSLASAAFQSTSEFHLTILTELDRVIQETYGSKRMTEADILQKRILLADMAEDLSGRNLTIEAFGSCCNGFGTVASDLDMMITGNITRSDIAELLRKEFSVSNISKRKPLIMLKHSPTDLHVDVTVNSADGHKMGIFMWALRKYSRLDSRAQVLGVFLKTVVKKLKISETEFGDLGSSTYIIMLLHYLQQTYPPVLVLPGISNNKNKTENFVVRNNATVGQLWLGFLRYYVHEFNYQENIICLYHVDCKTRKEKGWYSPDHNMISIERPTIEDSDQGKLLAPLMSDYILRVFNQLQTFYLKDNYDGLLRRNHINLDYHPRYGYKKYLLVDTWGYYNTTTCNAVGSDWVHSLGF